MSESLEVDEQQRQMEWNGYALWRKGVEEGWATWQLGMVDTTGRRVCWLENGYCGGIVDGDSRVRPDNSALTASAAPNFDDPATLGALLGLVRERCAPATWVHAAPLMTAGGVHGWRVVGTDAPSAPTEARALLRALEAHHGQR